MFKGKPLWSEYFNEKGASAVIVGVTLTVLFGFAALAVDISHIIGVRKELKNATDAGALAGAQEMFEIKPGGGYFIRKNNAIAEATTVTTSHLSQLTAVEVNEGDVVLGHWRFADDAEGLDAGFFPITNPPAELSIADVSGIFDEINKDTTFVNAIQVMGRREAISVVAFFAGIFGIESFSRARTSVAYIGPPTPGPYDFGGPIAVCKEAITQADGTLECNVGRMSSDTNSTGSPETAAWTDLTQGDTINDCPTASASEVGDVLDPDDGEPLPPCFDWQPPPRFPCPPEDPEYPDCKDWPQIGLPMAATNGVGATNYDLFKACWGGHESTSEFPGGLPSASVDHDDDENTPEIPIDNDGVDGPEYSIEMTLPVVECDSHPCYYLKGTVTVRLLWVSRDGQTSNPGVNNKQAWREVPMRLDDWTCPLIDPASPDFVDTRLHTNFPSDIGQSPSPGLKECEDCPEMTADQRAFCWNDFFSHFGIARPPGEDMTDPTLKAKTMYFIPACEGELLPGGPGGSYFGILSTLPKLVL
ncbi:Tad domain-containing protein [bacterium]|nr:Tad domain-containing protein [bacterium]